MEEDIKAFGKMLENAVFFWSLCSRMFCYLCNFVNTARQMKITFFDNMQLLVLPDFDRLHGIYSMVIDCKFLH